MVSFNIIGSGLGVKAISNDEATDYLNAALSEKTFYSFNVAYGSIMKISDENIRNNMLAKLDTLTSVVWTEDVKKYVALLDTLQKTGSGKIYDEMINQIQTSNLYDIDKEYLLGELTSWGKRLVYTQDYIAAVDAVVNAWTSSTASSIAAAEELILKLNNIYNKEYLTGELSKIKAKISKDTDSIARLKAAVNSSELSRDEKLAKLISIFSDNPKIVIPKGYMNTVGGYFILDYLIGYGVPEDMQHLQERINNGIALAELNKFEGQWYVDRKEIAISLDEIMPDSSNSKIDITDKVVNFSNPLIDGVTYSISMFTDLVPSEVFEIKDNRLYLLNPKALKEQNIGATNRLYVTVRYKNGVAAGNIEFKILPSLSGIK